MKLIDNNIMVIKKIKIITIEKNYWFSKNVILLWLKIIYIKKKKYQKKGVYYFILCQVSTVKRINFYVYYYTHIFTEHNYEWIYCPTYKYCIIYSRGIHVSII